LGGYNHGHLANLAYPIAMEMALGFRFTAERFHQPAATARLPLRRHAFGQRVAHGMLVTSIATGLQVEKMEPKIATAAFVGLDSWQFRAPVFIGDTIRVKRTIGEKAENEKNPKAGWCKYEIEVLNQEDKVVQRGVWNMLIQRKG
jgi:acyl dehydratase